MEDVVGRFQNVVITTNSEGQVGELADGSTVDGLSTLVGEGLNHLSDELLGTNQDGGTSIDDGVGKLVSGVTQGDLRNVDNPPGFNGDGVVLEVRGSELGINTTQNQSGTFLTSLVGQEEREGAVGNLTFTHEDLEDGGNVINRDGGEGHTQNTVELGSEERNTAHLGGLTEGDTSGGETTNGDGILRPGTRDTTGTVLDGESGGVLLVGGGLLGVVLLVQLASNGQDTTFRRGNPKVGRTGIEDNSENLGGGTDGDFTVVLGIHVVVDLNFGPLGEKLVGEELVE